MLITKLFTVDNNKSYFQDIDTGPGTSKKLGMYSPKYKAAGFMFRDFEKGLIYERIKFFI